MLQIDRDLVLSTHGSTRGTAYSMSNKIVRAGDTLIFGWLDSLGVNMVNSLDLNTGKLGMPFTLGTTAKRDNHCGPALAMTSDGHVHAILGTHHRPFHYRRTIEPGDMSAWTDPVPFGPDATYPSLTVDRHDTLHLACRAFLPRGVACKLTYLQKPLGGEWSEPIDVAVTPVRYDYTHYGNTLICDADGTLHLSYHLYMAMPQPRSDGQYYLRSADGGRTWTHSDGKPVALPATEDTGERVAHQPGSSVRGQGLAIAPDGKVFLIATAELASYTSLFRLDAPGQWTETDLRDAIARVYPNRSCVQDATMTFDKSGRMYICLDAKSADKPWGDVTTECLLLISDDMGETFDAMPVSPTDATTPHWLSSIERQVGPHALEAPPAILYTRGFKGVGCEPPDLTEIHLVTLTNRDARGMLDGVMPDIEIGEERELNNAWAYQVTVYDHGKRHSYDVTLGWSDYDLWCKGGAPPEKVVEAAFVFLLQREPASAILAKFDCSVIRRYFAEVDEKLPEMI